MTGLLALALARLRHDPWRAAVLVLALAVPLAVPLTTARLAGAFERELGTRAAATPLVIGARQSRFDLVLAALFFRAADVAPVPWSELERVGPDEGIAIPIHARFTARGYPLVGTSPEYLELRGLLVERGTPPLVLGDCVLGARVARALALGPGDVLSSDPRELYDLARPAALAMTVSGVLAEAGTADDGAVFTGVETAWILEGLTHGHAEPDAVDPALVLGRAGGLTALSEALIEDQRVTDANRASFHSHVPRGERPLSAVIVVPRDAKAATLLRARVDASGEWQAVSPARVIDELLDLVLGVKALLDALALVLLASTLAIGALVLWLSARLRAGETRALERIGASRGALWGIAALEAALVLAAGFALALAVSAAVPALAPDLSQALG